MKYPHAERQAVVELLHGHQVPDPYRWLEDPASPETEKWLAAQSDLWRGHAARLPGRERLRARLSELTDTGMVSVPIWRGERQFYLRRSSGQEHAVLYVVEPYTAPEILVDPVALDPSGLTTLDEWQPDLSGTRLAFQLSRRGHERSELYVVDVAGHDLIDGPIDRCRYSPVAWLAGGEAFYYVRALPGLPDRRVYLHVLGTPATDDTMVFGFDGDAITSYGLAISNDGRWLTLSASPGTAPRNDLWLADLETSSPAEPAFRVVQENVNVRSALAVGTDGRAYIATNLGAPRGRLCTADPAQPSVWQELVPEDPEAVLREFTILRGPKVEQPVLLIARSRHTIGEIGIHELATGERVGDVPLPGRGSIESLSTRPAGGAEVWFTYTDSVTPAAVLHYDARTAATTTWASAPASVTVPGVESHQLGCSSVDGTPVRLVVIARSDGGGEPRPTILYGYGGFGVSLTPAYAADALAWVEAGGVLAIANLRGGGEEGEQWHRAGMLDSKQNVFDDFIAAAEKLIADGWTSTERLGIWGESNGGLLVGAALTQRPELFAAAVCSAPLLDMARYERSGLGATWRGEYGTAADPDQLRWLLAYSPYHHVRAGVRYPATLFTGFGADSRVDPMHARKMCAALQWAGGDPILLRHEVDVGHGARAASRSIGLAADMLAFLAAHTGLMLP